MNKDIISKKQTKMYRDKMAFLEGYVYRWHLMPQNKRTRQGPKSTGYGSGHFSREEDYSLSSFSTLPTPSQPTNTRSNLGVRKRGLNGNQPFTPHPKKHLEEAIKHNPHVPKSHSEHSQMSSNSVAPVGTHTTTHLGPIAAQALNFLHNSPGS